jgi:drug/metabolite transporter (DMT)-like permease
MLKSSPERLTTLAGMTVVSGSAALSFVPFVSLPADFVFLLIGASVTLHLVYKIGLAALYTRADLSQGYPIARGLTPIVATMMGAITLGELPPPAALAGIGLISGGLLVFSREHATSRPASGAILLAALTGLCVAAYSAFDAYVIRTSGDWLSVSVWLVVCDSTIFLSYTFLTQDRAGVLAVWKKKLPIIILGGSFGIISFGIVVWALARAPIGMVSALRETSVLFAAFIGTAILKEPGSPLRYIAAILVTAGVMAAAASR